MPELPDVEGFRRVLADHAVGRPVQYVDVLDAGVLHGIGVRRLRGVLRRREFGQPWRHGKQLFVPVVGSRGGGAVLLHFGMTGSLHWATSPHRHDRIVFGFGDGELRYRDMRKLHGLGFARDENAVRRVLAELGPDAADLSASELRDGLSGLRRQVKPALVDQSVIAGLGNLLADEILWRAYIHPRRSCADLHGQDFARLHARMRTVLRKSIEQGRVPPRKTWLTGRRDEASGVCPRCGTALSHGRVGSRGTTWCPQCQPKTAT
ncbi:Fpg/Nei family DNA glycosylase [Kribbella capetownensis]|uniref:Fpg/Nei family DNA glycosylase n=1 Tax=Kribbella capetownensis TaxID=1572659 RepID=A0A4R0J7S3_9ACTN|nr:DNA-formamidopyrimidine glycosylase family protein [Kribbella capetownensis]TCC37445.1 Fpg/Nei family DNA glycosylase [Kribbella capetownensis]